MDPQIVVLRGESIKFCLAVSGRQPGEEGLRRVLAFGHRRGAPDGFLKAICRMAVMAAEITQTGTKRCSISQALIGSGSVAYRVATSPVVTLMAAAIETMTSRTGKAGAG